MRFAMNVLLTTRLRNAAQHLLPEAVNAEALSEFLQCSIEFGTEQLAYLQRMRATWLMPLVVSSTPFIAT